jgi:hypothetical protein
MMTSSLSVLIVETRIAPSISATREFQEQRDEQNEATFLRRILMPVNKRNAKSSLGLRSGSEATAAQLLRAQQLSLFQAPVNGRSREPAAFSDPVMSDNKNLPVHRWVPWIAGYSAPFVDDVISACLSHRQTGVILDPFCGVGTTLLQAIRRGYNAVGFEINPYPALAARVKLDASAINLTELDSVLTRMQEVCAEWRLKPAPTGVPAPLHDESRRRAFGVGKVINSDFFSADGEVETGTVNLMITSPPYMNNYHYVRNTRPQLYWLNFISSPSEHRYLETNNFGQFWQTVRDAEIVDLNFEHQELAQILKQLRETRVERGAYGGPGWANYVAVYFNDCLRFMTRLKRVLTRGGVGVIVIGNSIIQGIDIRTEEILGQIGVTQGLILEGVHRIREKRVGASITQSSVRQGERSKAVLSEFAVVVRKP